MRQFLRGDAERQVGMLTALRERLQRDLERRPHELPGKEWCCLAKLYQDERTTMHAYAAPGSAAARSARLGDHRLLGRAGSTSRPRWIHLAPALDPPRARGGPTSRPRRTHLAPAPDPPRARAGSICPGWIRIPPLPPDRYAIRK
jgi:hypothetical protein